MKNFFLNISLYLSVMTICLPYLSHAGFFTRTLQRCALPLQIIAQKTKLTIRHSKIVGGCLTGALGATPIIVANQAFSDKKYSKKASVSYKTFACTEPTELHDNLTAFNPKSLCVALEATSVQKKDGLGDTYALEPGFKATIVDNDNPLPLIGYWLGIRELRKKAPLLKKKYKALRQKVMGLNKDLSLDVEYQNVCEDLCEMRKNIQYIKTAQQRWQHDVWRKTKDTVKQCAQSLSLKFTHPRSIFCSKI